ncbi:MAG: hypothetical protein JO005_11515 [Gammaproteobacteria bacterium]|nr:hypothetical protein [Gammaproteobacteria bacterium]
MTRLALLVLGIAMAAWYAGQRSRLRHAQDYAQEKARWEGEGGATPVESGPAD